MACTLSIIVVGGGIGGLSAALALRQAGHDVVVIESTAWLQEAGAAICIPPNSKRTLEKLGVDFDIIKAVPFQNALTYEGVGELPQRYGPNRTATQLPWAPRAKATNAYHYAHRADLHDSLKAACFSKTGEGQPVKSRLSSKVCAWTADEGSIKLQDGTVLRADLIVAADGVHSKAHVEVLGYESPTKSSGVTNIRFLLSPEALINDPETKKIMSEGDDVAFTCYYGGRGGGSQVMLLRYPCRNYEIQNFGAHVFGESEEVTAKTRVPKSALIQLFESFPPEIRGIIAKAPDPLGKWVITDRPPIDRFHKGRLVLLGDAAHPMLTFQGQGASQSIEDAAVLGTLLRNLSDRSLLPQLLQAYDDLRVGRDSVSQLLSRNLTASHSLKEDLSQQIREMLPRLSHRESLAFDSIRHLDEKYKPGHSQLASFDDILNFFWEYDCIDDATKILERLLDLQKELPN